MKIYHKRAREDRHKNTLDALAVSVRICFFLWAIRRGASVCVGRVPALILSPSLYAKCKTHVRVACSFWLCSDVPVLMTKNVVPGGFLFLWVGGSLAMWYVLICVLSSTVGICQRVFLVLSRSWARHHTVGGEAPS